MCLVACGWDYTAGSGDFVGRANDISSGTVDADIAVDTDGTFYVFDIRSGSSNANKLYAFYPTGAQTARIMNIDRTHSFPLGSRQASTYGFGYDQTNDRFLVPNVTRINTYDKTVVSAARSYQRFDLVGIPRATDIGPTSFVVRGNRVFVFGEDSPQNDYDIITVKIYSWPDLRFIERRSVNSRADFGVINLNGRLFAPSNISNTTLYEMSPTSFGRTGTSFQLSGLNGIWSVLYEDGGTLYAKTQSTTLVRAYSAAGTANKTSDSTKEITVSAENHTNIGCMFSDPDYFYFGRVGGSDGSQNPLVFDAYSKTTRLRDVNGDLSFRMGFRALGTRWMGATVQDSIVYLSIAELGSVIALVKAV